MSCRWRFSGIISPMPGDPKPPDRLWKYRKWTDKAERMILHGELYFAKLDELNDPFDFYWLEQFPTELEEIDRYSKSLCCHFTPDDSAEQLRRNYDSFREQLIEISKRNCNGIVPSFMKFEYGVLCLSEVNDNLLMWSHYADQHQGVCISIRPDCIPSNRILPVHYCDDIPVIDAWNYIGRKGETFISASRSKSSHWKYEKEWRTVHHPGPHRFPGCVDQIVIGVRATAETRDSVLKAAMSAGNEITVYEATKSDGRYSVTMHPLSSPRPK